MALSLNPTLATAQNSQSRHPLVEILSQPMVADIPFDGQLLTSETTNEQKPNAITHSTGRLVLAQVFGTTKIRYFYTDPARTAFELPVEFTVAGTLQEVCPCELANGNIGIIYSMVAGDSTRQIRRIIISITGSIVVADALIESYASDKEIFNPFVICLANGTFLLVYGKFDTPNYTIQKRTCPADFVTWSAESACSIAGLDSAKPRYNPSLLQITTGDIWLWFEYRDDYIAETGKELTNIYYSVSTDNGSTWSAATKLTNYTTFSEIGRHPIAKQKAAGQMHVIFQKEMGALHIDYNSLNWCGGGGSDITNLSFDSANRKLYATSVVSGGGFKYFRCVTKIDVDAWHIDQCWNCGTTPGFNSAYCDGGSAYVGIGTIQGGSYLIPVALVGNNFQTAVLDGEANTITQYSFYDDAEHGLTKNVNWTPLAGFQLPTLHGVWIDFATKRLYLCIPYAYGLLPGKIEIGYIDLTQGGPPYTFYAVVQQSGYITAYDVAGVSDFFIEPSVNYAVVSSMEQTWTQNGRLLVFNRLSGEMLKDYNIGSNAGFPKWGLSQCCYYNGKIYGAFPYEAGYGEQDKRGLCIIDLGTDIVTYSRPSWATLNDYKLSQFHVTSDGKLIITTQGYGVTVYNTADNSWVLHDNDSLPGLTPDAGNTFFSVSYDGTNGIVFTGLAYPAGWKGLVAFSLYGLIKQSQYVLGTYTASWAFGATNQFLEGLMDYEAVIALSPADQSIYAFWTSQSLSELSTKWDREDPGFDLSGYLLMGSEISLKRTIDGTPASLTFKVSHAHLFDPHNSLSLWRSYLEKFRKINLRFGEKISGVDYWQQMGVFFITETAVDPGYERPVYSTMSIKAEDRFAMFEFAELITTPFYETYPELIIQDLLIDYAGLEAGDINIPTFDTRAYCYIQWIEQTIKTMIEQLCERFGYYPRIDIDGKVSARKISNSNPINHTYSDLTKLVNFSPDDSFSDWINRVSVKGDGRDWLEVLYGEEPVGSLSGACGWWHKRITVPVWYSTDRSRICRYPRLEVLESVKDGPYFTKDGEEHIGNEMGNELGFYVIINGPDLNELLIAAIMIWLIFKILAVILNGIPWVGGLVSLFLWICETFALYNIMAIMGTQGQYKYNFYARPVGKVRQTFQANANDLVLQMKIGMIVPRMIDDNLCYTIAQCQEVADFELMVVKNQRNRVKILKLAHLQDEDGDTQKINHPITNLPMTIFITDIERVMRLPSSSSSDDGSFLDRIEGWKIA